MTSAVVTLAGLDALEGTTTGDLYESKNEFLTYEVRVQRPAPPSIRISLELGREDNGVWAHIPEIDVSAEGRDINEAFRNVYAAACEWLSYMRDEQPDLVPELAEQARYVPLIDAPVFSWFKNFRFAD